VGAVAGALGGCDAAGLTLEAGVGFTSAEADAQALNTRGRHIASKTNTVFLSAGFGKVFIRFLMRPGIKRWTLS
jgi:hypothetical protein